MSPSVRPWVSVGAVCPPLWFVVLLSGSVHAGVLSRVETWLPVLKTLNPRRYVRDQGPVLDLAVHGASLGRVRVVSLSGLAFVPKKAQLNKSLGPKRPKIGLQRAQEAAFEENRRRRADPPPVIAVASPRQGTAICLAKKQTRHLPHARQRMAMVARLQTWGAHRLLLGATLQGSALTS